MIGILLSKWKWKIAQALEWRWWYFYLAQYPKQDYLNNKRAYWERMLLAAGLAPEKSMRLLDAGCGPAGLFILPLGGSVDALDPLLEQYQRRLPHFDPDDFPDVKFIPRPLEGFQPAGLYDVVWCFNAINHVENLELAAASLVEALQPGGLLVVSVDVHKYARLKKIFQYLPGDVLHPHQFDAKDYEALFLSFDLSLLRRKTLKKGLIFDYYLMVFEKSKA